MEGSWGEGATRGRGSATAWPRTRSSPPRRQRRGTLETISSRTILVSLVNVNMSCRAQTGQLDTEFDYL